MERVDTKRGKQDYKVALNAAMLSMGTNEDDMISRYSTKKN